MSTPQPSNRHEQLESFLTRIEHFIDIWPTIEIRYSAVKQAGEWRNFFTRATFSWNRSGAAPHGILALEDWFRAGRLTLQRDPGIAWLRNLAQGSVPVEDISLRMDHVQTSSANKPTLAYGWTELWLDRAGELRGLNQFERRSLGGYALLGNGGSAWELVSAPNWLRLDDLLFGLEHPFGGIAEFAGAYLGFSDPKTPGHPTAFEITAPFDSAFLGWSIRDGTTFVGSVTHPPSVPPSDLSVAAVLMGAGGTDRSHAQLAVGPDANDDSLVTSSFSFPWKEYRSMTLHLLLRGHSVDTLPAIFPAPGSPNPRFQALFGLGRLGDSIAEALDQPGSIKDTRRFELVVCWLLHMCGFQTIPTDQPSLTGSDVADLVAFDPYSNSGLVVEVTTRDPLSNEKLTKLRRRADTLAQYVASVNFYPVAVAAARDSFLETEIETANSLSITLLGHPDLQKLFELAQANELPGIALRRLLTLRTSM